MRTNWYLNVAGRSAVPRESSGSGRAGAGDGPRLSDGASDPVVGDAVRFGRAPKSAAAVSSPFTEGRRGTVVHQTGQGLGVAAVTAFDSLSSNCDGFGPLLLIDVRVGCGRGGARRYGQFVVAGTPTTSAEAAKRDRQPVAVCAASSLRTRR